MLALSRSTRLLYNKSHISLHKKCIPTTPKKNKIIYTKISSKTTKSNPEIEEISNMLNKASSKTRPPSKEQQKLAMEGLKSDLAELGNMLNKSAQTEEKRKSQPWGIFLKNAISKSKKELISIGTSFVCLILAFQVMGQQLASRRLKKENEGLVQERDLLLASVNAVQSEEFLKRVVERCLHVIRERRHGDSTPLWSWLFGNNTHQSNVTEEEIILRSILHEEIKKVVRHNENDGLVVDDETALITNMLESLQSEDNQDNDTSKEIDILESEDGKKIQRTRKFMM